MSILTSTLQIDRCLFFKIGCYEVGSWLYVWWPLLGKVNEVNFSVETPALANFSFQVLITNFPLGKRKDDKVLLIALAFARIAIRTLECTSRSHSSGHWPSQPTCFWK